VARHRDAVATRGISRGPVIAVAVVVALVLLTFGWFRLRDNVGEQGAQAAAACVSGTSEVTVVADPDVAAPLTELARRYTARTPVVRDRCVTLTVTPLPSGRVLTGLQNGWDPTTMGPPPAGWIAQDSSFPARLASTSATRLSGDPTSVASSPLVLAVPRSAGTTVTASGVRWADLPGLQRSADGWTRLGQPSWGAFTAALPSGASGSTLTPSAVEAVVAGVTGAAPTRAALSDPAVGRALTALGRGPTPQPDDTAAALTALGALTTVAGSPYQAVPATEQQVFAAAQASPGTVSAGVLAGTVPTEDYPFALLSGPAVDETQSRSAAAFEGYLAGDEAQQVLADAGFRTRGTLPAASDAVAFAPPAATLAPADPAATDALVAALTTPVVAPRTTVLLNVSTSMGTGEGGGTRLAATTGALAARVRALPDGTSIGLSTFVRGLGGSAPMSPDVPVAALTADGAQRSALLAALGALQTRGATSVDSSVVRAFADAVAAYSAAGTNRVVVVTDGPNDNGGTTEAGVLAEAGTATDPARPVQVDVIAIGSGDIGALTALARSTGGTVTQVPTGGSDAMSAALTALLT
jgi:hypothetical protein